MRDNSGATVASDNATVVTLTLSGTGTLSCTGGLSETVSNGLATFVGCSIDAPGIDTLHAESNPALTAADSASFLVTGPTLSFVQEPSGAIAGGAFSIQPSVAVESGSGATVTVDNSTVVTLSLTGTGTLSCEDGLSRVVSSGIATFSNCSVDTAGTHTIHATSNPALIAADTTSFEVTDPATKLALLQWPDGGISGETLATQPSVTVQDGSDNTVTEDGTTEVTLSLIGAGTLTCDDGLSKAVSSGVATFSGCSVDTAGDFQIHAASDPVLTPADTPSFTLTGPPAALAFGQEPDSGSTGLAFSLQPIVIILDGSGTTVISDDSTDVPLSLTGTGTLACDGGLAREG